MAIHPELVNKLINFQNSVLGNTVVNEDENLECDSSGKTSDAEGEQNLSEPRIAVELKTEDSNDRVKIDKTNIPLVSYSAKVSKSSTSESKASKLLGIKSKSSMLLLSKDKNGFVHCVVVKNFCTENSHLCFSFRSSL